MRKSRQVGKHCPTSHPISYSTYRFYRSSPNRNMYLHIDHTRDPGTACSYREYELSTKQLDSARDDRSVTLGEEFDLVCAHPPSGDLLTERSTAMARQLCGKMT
ncbi:hypothetical protein K0M31_001147 [Melipona bicolor]|uniref:Uncharacterized protein n=1 Tax=Melipona bicolor TaxID=60889 RepID=A0AA40GEY2_9HYME|nr:hypothetical protein K0M31_001147 [Melipona bicolor]